ncbi:MAG: hypothetical protein JWQ87_5474 [Candidatus Sulfotelmatobacter sp.]|nr:hypothetical protein [Candidatus Sulfotelmatobacter sp.]
MTETATPVHEHRWSITGVCIDCGTHDETGFAVRFLNWLLGFRNTTKQGA